MGAYTYSGTAASNTTVDGIGAAGSDSPDNIDNLIRALAASDANLLKDIAGYNTVAGTADAITIALADASTISNYTDKLIGFVAASDNATTSPTLNVDSVGAEPIKKAVAGAETALIAGDIQGGAYCLVRWRSTWDSGGGAWELLNPYSVSTGALRAAQIGIGTASDSVAPIYILGASEQTYGPTDAGTKASIIHVISSGAAAGDGGSIKFGAASNIKGFAAIKGYLTDGGSNTQGRLSILTRAAATDTSYAERLTFMEDGSWRVAAAAGSNGQVVKQVSGATAWAGISTFATQQTTTSGTTVDFTSIPSWVREIDVLFNAVSTNGGNDVLVQIGPSGTPETTGYVSSGAFIGTSANADSESMTSGFGVWLSPIGASGAISGVMQLKNTTGNVWVESHSLTAASGTTMVGGGVKTTSSAINILRVTVSAGAFDAGAVNICYR